MSLMCRLFGHRREMHHLIYPFGKRVPACGRCFALLPTAPPETPKGGE